jgi:Na+-transporting NADH:ubiquinone oxidoreductase subunit F
MVAADGESCSWRARRLRLVHSGEVRIVVNDDAAKSAARHPRRRHAAEYTLVCEQKIFVPSACGGKGSCGVCKVEVHEGGGSLLPTESGLVTRRRGAGWRALVLSGQGQAEHEDSPRRGDLRGTEMALRACDPTTTWPRSSRNWCWSCRPVKPYRFGAGGYIQIECPPHTVHYRDLIYRCGVS